jgi:hypothetical protein
MVDYSEEHIANDDNTLSLSFTGNMNDSNYKVYDSAYGKSISK